MKKPLLALCLTMNVLSLNARAEHTETATIEAVFVGQRSEEHTSELQSQ